jgi:hypothetical protein
MKIKTLVIVITITFLIISCSGNSIYYNSQKKGIMSCEGSFLSTLIIAGTGNNYDFYYITSNKGVEVFKPKDIHSDFVIKDKKDNIIANSDFRLKPLSEYKISNTSKGDAGEQWLIVKTDNNGEIINADKIHCD